MKNLKSCLFIFFVLILLPCQLSSEEKNYTYTDQDLKKLHYEKITPDKKPAAKGPSGIIEYKDTTEQLRQQMEQQEENKQRIEYRKSLENAFTKTRKEILAKTEKEIKDKATERLLILIILITIPCIIWLFTFIDILRNEFTGSNKMIWFLATTFFPVIGPIVYFFIGNKYKIDPEELP